MAAAESVLDTYLQFLDTSASGTDQASAETPHIDTVLSHYRGRYPQTNYDQRLKEVETQLSSLLHRRKGKDSSKTKQPLMKDTPQNASDSSDEKYAQSDKTTASRHTVRHKKTSSSPTTQPKVSSLKEDKQEKKRLLSQHYQRVKPERHVQTEHIPTVQALTKELEGERENRWKAEQAAIKLTEHVRSLQSQTEEFQRKLELHITNAVGMEKSLTKEKEKAKELTDKNEKLSVKLSECCCDKDKLMEQCQQQTSSLHSLEEQLHKIKIENTNQTSEMVQQVKDAEVRAAVSEKESELQKNIVKQLDQQLRELQQLLATRERQHQEQLEHLRPPNATEIKNLIETEVLREKEKSDLLVAQLQERLEHHQKAYQKLEQEFRMALRIETSRYNQLEQAHGEVTGQLKISRDSEALLKEKESKSTSLVSELTTIVKEQKARIAKLVNSKHESLQHYKERVSQLEVEATGKNRIEARMVALKEENAQISARLAAQEAVLSGLREERKLWSEELAHQGASLAQDRGRMESRIETLTNELRRMREQQQNDRTSIQVKEKVIVDQTQTIERLRQDLSALEDTVDMERREHQQEGDILRQNLEQEQALCQDLQERMNELQDLKSREAEQVRFLEEQVEQWKDKYSKLRGQWEQKVALLSSLENDVGTLQQQSAAQVAALTKERDEARQAAKAAVERLTANEEAFKTELDKREKTVEQRMQHLLDDKNREVALAQQKVEAVEQEMRVLLSETAKEKKTMEFKFHKLSSAFQELQQELN